MHIPDGFLDGKTIVATGALAAGGLGVALRHARTSLPPNRVPLLGLAAAFVFAAQLVNFPVGAGTSGHLVGGVLVAALLGPSAAVIVLSAVLIVQCLMFADGGLSALGANILNMGLFGTVGGWAIYRAVGRAVGGLFGRLLAAAFAGWCSTVVAAVACAGELAVSRTAPLAIVLPAMAGVHMLVGLGEGLITALVLAAIARARPELLADAPAASRHPWVVAAYGALAALAVALFLSPLASAWPDGLERVAARLGFAGRASAPIAPAAMAGYAVPGVPSSILATSLAGGVGAVVAFALAWLLARSLAARETGVRTGAGGPPAGGTR